MRPNILTLVLCLSATAAAAPKDRITIPIDGGRLVTLPDHTRRLATSYVDQGALEPSRQMDGVTLYLKPSTAQKMALDQLLIDLQDPASPHYHRWLTPEEYADRFAITSSDAARITAWLQAQGFQIGWVGRGRSVIVFNGKVGQVEEVFHPEIHRYRSGATVHYANSRNPSVPAALADIVRALGGLDDFTPVPSEKIAPAWNNPAGTHYLAPGDLATIYGSAPLLAQGIDGTGQTLGIVGTTSLLMSDIQTYRTQFGLPAANVKSVLVPGFPNPGLNSASLGEANLDVQVSGAVAPNAAIVYVYSTTALNAITYLIDQALAPTVSSSFGAGCEANNSASTLLLYQALAQQGNAEGITWLTGAGDNGPAECDTKGAPLAMGGSSVKVPAGVPEITVTGGTDFMDQPGTYWASSNGPTGGSALSYIPEVVWNTSTPTQIATTGGGVSSFFAKPSWQVGPGVPNDGHRDLPDLAFHASLHEGYKVVVNGATNIVSGGDSATGPVLSGMLALVNQLLVANGAQAKPGLGNINPTLYRLAQSNPSAFHDIVSGNNIVSCGAGTSGCVNGQMGYSAGPGYDLCTGLGSLDLARFAAALLSLQTASSVVASGNPNPAYQTVDSNGVSSWNLSLTLTNNSDVPTTLTGFAIDGNAQDLSGYISTLAIAAGASVQSANVALADTMIPQTHVFSFTGSDESGRSWTTSVSIPFLGPAASPNGAAPVIAGVTNGASFQQLYAPGMILDIFGLNLAAGTQLAATVPLSTYMQSSEATVNGVLAPLYYVSPTQVNVQIPYGTAPGTATLVVYQAGQSTTSQIQIVAAAPGIFTDGNGNTVPDASGSAGQTLTLFITGDGEVSPPLASGTAPATSIPVTGLPKSNLPVSMTIGGQPAQIVFNGIPYGLAGVTQINFVVPAGLTPGPQPVVITVGSASSNKAMFTIAAGS